MLFNPEEQQSYPSYHLQYADYAIWQRNVSGRSSIGIPVVVLAGAAA
ncbi:hypothetical protein [Flavobacterium anhuiense]|nr:hypothetical protein [Flavobacterium anhuiense]